MRKYFFLILTSIVLVSFSGKIPEKDEMVRINDNLYVLNHEITNYEFSLFLKDSNYLIDTLNWMNVVPGFTDHFSFSYHSHEKYKDFPVVNISFEAAKSYCDWLTIRAGLNKDLSDFKVVFDLPTIKEWKQYAFEQDTLSSIVDSTAFYWGDKVYSKTGELNANFFIPYEYRISNIIDPLYPSKSLIPNEKSLFHLFGNVAEMTSKKGVAVGGSWRHLIYQSGIDSVQKFDSTASWLGFRPICRIQKK